MQAGKKTKKMIYFADVILFYFSVSLTVYSEILIAWQLYSVFFFFHCMNIAYYSPMFTSLIILSFNFPYLRYVSMRKSNIRESNGKYRAYV